jgi:hypothetical protein
MHAWTDAHRDWLVVERFPARASELNPAEGAWAHMKNSLGLRRVASPPRLRGAVNLCSPTKTQRDPECGLGGAWDINPVVRGWDPVLRGLRPQGTVSPPSAH